MMKKSIFMVFVSVITLSLSQSVFALTDSQTEHTTQSEDNFYNAELDKHYYEEYKDAKLNIRESTTIKGLPGVFEKVNSNHFNKQGKNYKQDLIKYTERFDPTRKVYYYFSLREADNDIFYQSAMFDAETKELMYADKGKWLIKK